MLRAVLMVLLLALPVAGAQWRAVGGLEPDTPEDVEHGRMFDRPLPGRVYFQAFVALPETSSNPNVALLGTRVLPAPAAHHRALLGIWTDCNGDGYIGNAESALQDYSARLLLDSARCPAEVYRGFPIHNDGQWVSELLMIGMVDPCEHEPERAVRDACGVDAFAPNERVFYVDHTFVWGDLGAPGSIPRAECILAPLPRGTTTSPGAALAWADCQSRRGLTPAVKQLDRDGALDRPFPATPFGHGDSPGLLQDDTDRASVTAWDCSMAPVAEANDPQGRREVVVADPTGRLHAERFPLVVPYTLTGIGFVDEDRDPSTPGVFRRALTDDDGTYARIPGFGAPQAQPTASWWVAAERALDGPAGDCDDATPSALAPHYPGRAVESDATPILEARKDRPSLTFTFYDGHRGLHPELDPTTGPLTPSDGGTMVLDHGRGGDGPMWSALARSEQDPQLVNRDDLGFTPALYFTYYAHIGPDGLGFPLPQAASREYGIDNCGSATNGIEKGWVCDSGLWWKDAHGNDVTPRYAQGMRVGRVVGDPYHLRDVDCYDGEIARALGVRASLVDLTSEGACPA